MSSVQIEQNSYEMPPREGISIAQFLTVADIERSARYYEKVFGARILSMGDGNAPAYECQRGWDDHFLARGPTHTALPSDWLCLTISTRAANRKV